MKVSYSLTFLPKSGNSLLNKTQSERSLIFKKISFYKTLGIERKGLRRAPTTSMGENKYNNNNDGENSEVQVEVECEGGWRVYPLDFKRSYRHIFAHVAEKIDPLEYLSFVIL